MLDFELSDSVAQSNYGEPVDLLREETGGRLKALWLPSVQVMAKPTPLRHVSSTVLIHSSLGYVWLVSMWNQAWTEELVSRAEGFLQPRAQTWSWKRLEVGLSETLEREVVLHKECALDQKLSVLEIPRMADAVFRRWMSQQSNLSDVDPLVKMKAELVKRIERSADVAVAEFMSLVNPEIKALSERPSLSLDLYNYVADPVHHQERMQFTEDFPLLARFVYSAQTKSVWRELGLVIDKLKSPVRFLSEALKVRPAAVRALRGVAAKEVGDYFEAHPAELIELLDSLPTEHIPKTSSHWGVFQEQYRIAKKFFGRSSAGSVFVKARVGHAMRYAVGLNRPVTHVHAQDVYKVERLKDGLIQASYTNYGVPKSHSLAIQLKASITQKVDHFLGHLSWMRLLELSRKWEKCYAEAVQSNADSIKFVSGDQYWNFIPDSPFVTANGWTVRCLLTVDELKGHGVEQDICLANTGTRVAYHHDCLCGSAAIFAVCDSSGAPSSTAEFKLSTVGDGSDECAVRFDLIQHMGPNNRTPGNEDVKALNSLVEQFLTRPWQTNAREGVQLSGRRAALRLQDKEVSVALTVVGLQAFSAVFGKDRADTLLQQFSGRADDGPSEECSAR